MPASASKGQAIVSKQFTATLSVVLVNTKFFPPDMSEKLLTGKLNHKNSYFYYIFSQ